jgi:hypothetical protein
MSKPEEKVKLVPFEVVREVPRAEKLRILIKCKQELPEPAVINFSKFHVNEWEPPTDNGEARDRWTLLEETRDIALPRFLLLQNKFPPGSFATFGIAANPLRRDWFYNSSSAYYRRDSFKPAIKLEEQILFRSNNRFNALTVEYLLQYHFSEGLWKDEFSTIAIPQKHALPALAVSDEQWPTYVYAKFSRTQETWSLKDKFKESHSDKPGPSKKN